MDVREKLNWEVDFFKFFIFLVVFVFVGIRKSLIINLVLFFCEFNGVVKVIEFSVVVINVIVKRIL